MTDEWGQHNADLDKHDLALLERVETDFDMSLEELAAGLDLSKSAIHYRLKKLREWGVIESVTADIDPSSLGLSMIMITEVMVNHETGYAEDIGSALVAVSGVAEVYYTMGDVDFMVITRVQNRKQMNEVLDNIVSIDGVNETSSRFVMDELKSDGQPIASLSEAMRDDITEHPE